MGKLKRPSAKPVPKTLEKSRYAALQEFLHDWGRLVIPLGVLAILAALRFLGVLEDTGLGFTISVLFLAAAIGGAVWLAWINPFPRWVRAAVGVAGALVLVGGLIPLTQMVYPATAVFQEVVNTSRKSTPLDPSITGFHYLEVYAVSMANRPDRQGAQGRYHLKVAGRDIEGTFADVMRSVRAGRRGSRSVEQKHLMDLYTLTVPEGEKTLEVIRIDPAIGPDLQVSLFPVLIPPVLGYLLLVVALGIGVLPDVRFPGLTERWRLAPWLAMPIAFLAIFESAYERGGVTNAAVWSAVFGGIGGFTVGWLLSVLARKVFVRVVR